MYAKVFSQIYDSSIAEKPDLRFTFIDMLVLADRDGVVDMTHEAIARRTNRPIEVIRSTIAELEAPDPHSRTPDAGGARLKRLDDHRDWGWVIINFDQFHRIATDEQRRAKTKARVDNYRQKTRGNEPCNAPVTLCNAPVTLCNAVKRMKRHTDTDVDTDINNSEIGGIASPPRNDGPHPNVLLLDAARKGAGIFRPATDKWCEAVMTWTDEQCAAYLRPEPMKAYYAHLKSENKTKYDGPNMFTGWFDGSKWAKPVVVERLPPPVMSDEFMFSRLPIEERDVFKNLAKAQLPPGTPLVVVGTEAVRLWKESKK